MRITCGDYMLQSTLLPRLAPLLRAYPDICMEFDVYYGLIASLCEPAKIQCSCGLPGICRADLVSGANRHD